MRSFKSIRDPKAFELMGDSTWRQIIYLLRAKEMTVSQLAADPHVTTQAVYHQINKLKEAGLVEVAKEERTDHSSRHTSGRPRRSSNFDTEELEASKLRNTSRKPSKRFPESALR